jgi:threonine dehydrogenase-like Zn-dependent dehydrogenase
MGARVIALDVSPERLEMAKRMGADITINPTDGDAVEAIRDHTRGGADKAIECSANVHARRQAILGTGTWGVTCMTGYGGSVAFESSDIILKNRSVVGALTFSKGLQAACADFVIERRIDVDQLFTHSFALDQAAEAYRLFDQKKIGKGVFLFD